MGHIEAELHGRTDLIDILTSRAGGADELLMNFLLIDRDRASNSNHAFSVRGVGLYGKRIGSSSRSLIRSRVRVLPQGKANPFYSIRGLNTPRRWSLQEEPGSGWAGPRFPSPG